MPDVKRNVDVGSFTDDQKEMVDVILDFLRDSSRKELRIGGVAGTGKTSVISLIPEFAGKAGLRPDLAYCAFTGKAANVMRSKGMPATTIHSLIYHASVKVNEETQKVEYEFGLKDSREVGGDVIVVDEASTVSQQLYQDLMKMGRKVVFVGDYGQLPPIGTDVNLMQEDLLDFKLTKVHRQAEKSDIIRLSMAVRNGDQVAFHSGPETAKVHAGDVGVEDLLRYGQVLCGYNSTRMWLNSEMRKAYGFKSEAPERKDKMTFLRNDARRTGTFNGQQVLVLSCRRSGPDFVIEYVDIDDKDAGKKQIRILGKALNAEAGMGSVNVTRDDIRRCPQSATFAYAITTHKCVTGDTVVRTEEHGAMRLADYAGEKVFDGVRYVRPSGFFRYESCPCLKMTTEGGRTLTATLDHRQPTCRGTVRFADLAPGMVLITESGYDPVASVEDAGLNDVFCLEIPGSHTFMQNGILSGNSQGSEWPTVALWDAPSSFTAEADVRRRFLYTAITRASKYFLWIAP